MRTHPARMALTIDSTETVVDVLGDPTRWGRHLPSPERDDYESIQRRLGTWYVDDSDRVRELIDTIQRMLDADA